MALEPIPVGDVGGSLGARSRHCLITGSSGFIGAHLVRRFRQFGWNVRGIGRRVLDAPGYEYISHDLGNSLPSTVDRPVDVVIHAAARSNPWGTRAEFERDNVDATRHVIDFCLRNGWPGDKSGIQSTRLPRLVYISSSSVCYRPQHQIGVTEETPLPDRAVNLYAATKREAERLVESYPGPWVILRPRAVFGPGDTVLLPRIIRAAQEGRLPLLYAPGSPVVGDLIYTDNLVDAVQASAESDSVSGVFYLTNDEPVPILDFLMDVFDRLGIPRPTRRVSARTAMLAAGCLEAFHHLFRPRVEPAITRFGVHVFRYSKTFDVSKAKRVLGPPRVPLSIGLERTVYWFRTELERTVPR